LQPRFRTGRRIRPPWTLRGNSALKFRIDLFVDRFRNIMNL